MDVKEIQKINELAKDLVRHGIVKNSDEAIIQARTMLTGKKGFSQTDNNNNQTGEEEMSNEDLRKIQQLLVDYDERFKMIFEKMNEMVKEINDTQSVVRTLHEENQKLKEQVKESQSRPQVVVQQAAPVQQPAHETHHDEPQEVKYDEHEKGFSPRSGNYKPDDVSVDKMFYFGTKK